MCPCAVNMNLGLAYYVQYDMHIYENNKDILRLCTGRTAHRGSRGITLPFLDNGTRKG